MTTMALKLPLEAPGIRVISITIAPIASSMKDSITVYVVVVVLGHLRHVVSSYQLIV